jgi:hypothetical protein
VTSFIVLCSAGEVPKLRVTSHLFKDGIQTTNTTKFKVELCKK